MTKTNRQKYLTKEEYLRFMESIFEDTPDYVLFFLCGNLGLRVGEVIRLRVWDIDFANKYIRIPTLKQDGEKQVIDGKLKRIKKGSIKRGQLPKTYCDLPLTDDMVRLLKVYTTRYKVKNWLFPWTDGLHIPKLTVQRLFKDYAKKAKLDSAYSIHSLRHMKGTLIYNDTESLALVKEILRHKSVSSSEVYSHMGLEKKREVMDRLGTIGKRNKKE